MDANTNQGRPAPAHGSQPFDGERLHSKPLLTDALAFLEQQHVSVNRLFAELDNAFGTGDRADAFRRVADALAIHTAIEERYFYPAIRTGGTEDLLLDSLHEHLEIKRAIVDLVQLSASDEMFEGKVATLRQLVGRHVKEDESELFPRVRRLFTSQALFPVVEQMQEQVAAMEGMDARFRVFPEAVDPSRL